MDMAERLRQRRKQLKLTQTQLATAANMTQQMIQQLETRKVLTTGKLLVLAEALRVRPQWLETGAEPMVDAITPDERGLLEEYRHLEPEKRPVVRATLRAMLPALTLPPLQLKAEGVSANTPEQSQAA